MDTASDSFTCPTPIHRSEGSREVPHIGRRFHFHYAGFEGKTTRYCVIRIRALPVVKPFVGIRYRPFEIISVPGLIYGTAPVDERPEGPY